jgi:hypothetical protein
LKRFLLFLIVVLGAFVAHAQVLPGRGLPFPQNQNPAQNTLPTQAEKGPENIDSLRALLDSKKDSIVYNAKYIKFTKEEFLRD